jgi:hypothetical protein
VDLWLILWLVVVVVLVLFPVIGMGRMAWRIWCQNEEMEPGGSYGRQFFGRSKHQKPETPSS